MGFEKRNTILKIDTLDISISNSVEHISKVLQKFKDFAQSCEIPSQTIYKTEQVLVEIVDSIIDFNCSTKNLDNIFIEFKLFQSGKLVININYKGMPFNPFFTTSIESEPSLVAQEIGGLGLHLTKRLMDEYSYHRKQETNLISMIKTLV